MRPFLASALLRPIRLLACLGLGLSLAQAAPKKVLLIAGTPSHGPAQHEHNAGVLLLQHCLQGVPGLTTVVALNGWPADAAAFSDLSAVVFFCDGGPQHLALRDDHLARLDALLGSGVGLGLIHYAVEPTVEKGEAEFLRWAGGCFELNWSVNPVWKADLAPNPVHPVTRGVHPFSIEDEWYFHLRFAPGRGVTPLLTAVPPATTMARPDGPHEGNPAVRAAVAAGERQTVVWAYERPNGGRGFGFSGAHYHRNWGDPNFRKVALNGIVWLAGIEVPPDGIASEITAGELSEHLDPKPAPRAKPPVPQP